MTNNNLELQVRAIVSNEVASVQTIDVEEIMERPIGDGLVRPHGRPVRTSTGRWQFVAAVLAAAATIVIVGGVALLRSPVPNPDPNDQPAISTSSPTTTSSPEPSTTTTQATTTSILDAQSRGPYTNIDWRQIDWGGTSPRWVSPYPTGGFVAGSLGQPARYSTDGLQWTTEPFSNSLAGYRDLYIDGRYALANSVATDYPELDELWIPHQTWASGISWEVLLEFDGTTWQRIDVGYPVMEPPVRFGATTIIFPLNPDGTPIDDYVQSVDGATFTRHRIPGGGGPVNRSEFFTHPAGFGVYGEARELSVSRDGVIWDAVDIDFNPSVHGAPHIVHFIDAGDVVYAQPLSDPILWASRDGRTWSQLTEPDAGNDDVRALHRSADQLVLTTTGSDGATIWASPDGTTWTALPDPPAEPNATSDPILDVAGSSVFYFNDTPDGVVVWQGILQGNTQ